MGHHVVRRGETLSAIASRYRTTVPILVRMNDLASPDRLRLGQRLTVPDIRAPTTPATGDTSARTAAPALGPRARSDTPAPPSVAPAVAAEDVTEAQLLAIMPRAGDRAATYVAPLNEAMRAHGIDTPERRAAFLAQISVESGQLCATEENLNYSAARLREVWPRRFPDDATAQRYARNPEALGNHVYASRLGNGNEASGDGYRFRGRGLMQTTGRNNYRDAGYEDDPEALARPATAADSAAQFWEDNELNARAERVLDRAQFNRVSRRVNGGDHGSDERWQAYQRALRALGRAAGG